MLFPFYRCQDETPSLIQGCTVNKEATRSYFDSEQSLILSDQPRTLISCDKDKFLLLFFGIFPPEILGYDINSLVFLNVVIWLPCCLIEFESQDSGYGGAALGRTFLHPLLCRVVPRG